MATYNADKATVQFPAPSASVAGDVKYNEGFIDLAVTGALAVDDIVNLAKVPAQHVLCDALFDCDELDEGVDAITLDFQLYDPVTDTAYAVVAADNDVGQAGGFVRLDQADALNLPPVDYDRYLRAVVSAGPGTGATTGKLRGTAVYRGAEKLD